MFDRVTSHDWWGMMMVAIVLVGLRQAIKRNKANSESDKRIVKVISKVRKFYDVHR